MAENIIDPNNVNPSDSLVNLGLNASPDYSDMFIFAELTVKRRGSSVIELNGVGKPNSVTNDSEDVKINLMGFDKDSGEYTTRWTENIGGNVTPFEGFGMTQIKMSTNSSYIPTVDIEFVDIRGMSLVSLGTKSPYSAIYSFPPPVYDLTLKGYYGKATTYRLHMVKQSTKFDASSGNYFISINFVAQRFSPLTDVLFKYIDVVPLMGEGVNISGTSTSAMDFNTAKPAANTRELITRGKKLYDDLQKNKIDSTESAELEKIKEERTSVVNVINSILSFKSLVEGDVQPNFGMFSLFEPQNLSIEQGANMDTNNSSLLKRIIRLAEYDEVIKGFSPAEINDGSLNQRLCILYEYDEKSNGIETVLDANKTKIINSSLDNIINNLYSQIQNVDSDIFKHKEYIEKKSDIPAFNKKKYIGIDITRFYLNLRKKYNNQESTYNTKNQIFIDKINKLSLDTLGEKPTIRNIFRVLTKDVETFFKKLRETSVAGERHHNDPTNNSKIIGNLREQGGITYPNNVKNISPFPLVIEGRNTPDSVDSTKNLKTRVRAYPGNTSLGLLNPSFPEVDFVEDFISTMIKIIREEQDPNLKESIDDDGNNKWLPMNPIDSVVNGRTNATSPYKNITKIFGAPTEPTLINEMLNRFYLASQYSYCYLFYKPDAVALSAIADFFGVDVETKNDSLVKYLAQAEATNVVNSITDPKLLSALKGQSDSWSQNINAFYDALESSTYQYNTMPNVDQDLGTSFLILNGQKITKNRVADYYKGFEVLNSVPQLRSTSKSTSDNESKGEENIVEKFIDKQSGSVISDLIFDKHGFDTFTTQNIPYIYDEANQDDKYDSDFIYNFANDFDITFSGIKDTNILSTVSTRLSYMDNFDKTVFNDPNFGKEAKAYYLLKYYVYAQSFYRVENDINLKFAQPAVIEVPRFSHLYMGALMYFFKFNTPSSPNPIAQAQIDYYNNTYKNGSDYFKAYNNGSIFESNSSNSDPDDCINIANNDADTLLNEFTTWIGDTSGRGFGALLSELIDSTVGIIKEIELLNLSQSGGDRTVAKRKSDEYVKRLEPASNLKSGERNHSIFLERLMEKKYILNYTEITFLPVDPILVSENGSLPIYQFLPLSEINKRSSLNTQINGDYFNSFFREISRLCEEKQENLIKQETKLKEGIDNNDIKTQMYYSFKAIADKWVVGLDNEFSYGYGGKNLIDEFMFVDRFFNDIGDKVVIDFRPIIEMSKDYDISVFSLMSRILALNGFEFFPLQNFMNFNSDEWQNSFRTYGSSRTLIRSQAPMFICMYIGGTSSQLDDPLSGHDDDGFPTVESMEKAPDFNTKDAKDNVKGFRVGFGRQNQSMFSSIELNTNEHKETNESLAILSELAQDQSAASPVPIGQNLYSVYEQRSYNCKVQGFGNMMIQPTQYFVLENVPMFNGAYLILNVEHVIVPNNMKTSFMGVRLRANTNPIITDFAAAAGVSAGSSNTLGAGSVNQSGKSIGSSNNPKYNPSSIFPLTPPVNKDMTGRLISPNV